MLGSKFRSRVPQQIPSDGFLSAWLAASDHGSGVLQQGTFDGLLSVCLAVSDSRFHFSFSPCLEFLLQEFILQIHTVKPVASGSFCLLASSLTRNPYSGHRRGPFWGVLFPAFIKESPPTRSYHVSASSALLPLWRSQLSLLFLEGKPL